MNKKITRKTKKTKAPLYILLVMIFIVIGIIATIFSFFVIDDVNKGQMSKISSNSSVKDTASKDKSSEASSQAVSEAPSQTASSVPTKESPTVVVESEAVDKSYFDDAIFIGDSISKGLKLYGVLPATNVIADQNVGLDQIANDKPVYMSVSGQKKTLFAALQEMKVKPKKIYVLLGSNGLPGYDNDTHIKFYEKVLDRLIKSYPNVTFYIQSVTPITKQAEADYKRRGKDFTNDKINKFNAMVLKLAENKGVNFINVKDSLIDKNGYLSSDFSAADGVHFKKSGHEAMYQYYKTHAIKD